MKVVEVTGLSNQPKRAIMICFMRATDHPFVQLSEAAEKAMVRRSTVAMAVGGIRQKLPSIATEPVRTKAKLPAVASEYTTMLEQSPERVVASFQDRGVSYAP